MTPLKPVSALVILFLLANTSIAQFPSLAWVRTFGSTNIDRGYEIAFDPGTGDIYTAGSFTNTVDFDPGPGVFNMTAPGASNDDQVYIAKFNAAGDFIWAKNMGGTENDVPAAMVIDPNTHDVYLGGRFKDICDFDPGPGVFNMTPTGTLHDLFVVKLDSAGSFIWARQFEGYNGYLYGLALDGTGNIFISGFFNGTSQDFDPGPATFNLVSNGFEDIFVCKIDTSGSFVWAKNFGSGSSDYCYALTTDNNGNVYVTGLFDNTIDFDPGTGTFNLTCIQDDAYLLKLDAGGNFVYAKQIGGSGSSRGLEMTLDANNNLLLTGYFSDTTDFDPGPITNNIVSAGQQDAFILKLDAAGNYLWAKTWGSTSTDLPASITLDATGNIYITGTFFGTTDLDPGAGVVSYTSLGLTDGFISILNPTGDYLWSATLAGPNYTNPYAIKLDNAGNIYTIGSFGGDVDFDPGIPVLNITSAGSDDIYFQKLSYFSTGINKNETVNNVLFYPNPTRELLTVENLESGSELKLVNTLGETVYFNAFAHGTHTSINMLRLPAGIYFLHVKSKGGVDCKKIIHSK